MTIVIGLHGAKGSGKDQFYKAVKQNFPSLNVKKIAYADPIKEQVCKIFDLDSEEDYDIFKRINLEYYLRYNVNTMEKVLVEGRKVVREIGMLMRSYDPRQFVSYVEDTIRRDPYAVWCVTDLRFQNEYDSIRAVLGGVVVKVKRDGYEFDGHITETEIPDSKCDFIINNNNLSLQEYNTLATMTMNTILNYKEWTPGIK